MSLASQVLAAPQELQAPQLFDASAPPSAELKRLNAALAVSYAELLRHATKSNNPPLRSLSPRSALADGAAGYDERVHVVAVLLENMHWLIAQQRESQALDALALELERLGETRRAAAAELRRRLADAREVGGRSAEEG